MILPIVGYGHPTLRKRAQEIDKNYPELDKLIADMFETMYNAHGVGLAAPQVNLPIRLFVVDGSPMEDNEEQDPSKRENMKDFKRVFINAKILEESGEEWAFREGCLSIPEIREDVFRKGTIKITYLDEQFVEHTEVLKGMQARIVQHEYDHIEGVLFTDHISAFRRTVLKKRLDKIKIGQIDRYYPMRFAPAKR